MRAVRKRFHACTDQGASNDARRWHDAVGYEIYVPSFADGNGDGVGDLVGAINRLDHVAALGADLIWMTPFYPSPMADHGYDVKQWSAFDHGYDVKQWSAFDHGYDVKQWSAFEHGYDVKQWSASEHVHHVAQPENADLFASWRAVADEYDAMLLGETYVLEGHELGAMLRGDGLHAGF